jgi:PhzF family phenazine biosynthesis protein
MSKYPIYQIDAFAEKPFSGNPAAVVIFNKWPEKQVMQNIALENNLSETAFIVKQDDGFYIRYFTPTIEVELCGHATLASGFVLFKFFGEKETITFHTTSKGDLFVSQKDDLVILNFPTDNFISADIPDLAFDALGYKPVEAYMGLNDLMLVYEEEEQIAGMVPNFNLLEKIKSRGICVTAPGKKVDFVSRFFAPQSGIPEDPVTGSAHTTLIPYWSARLGKATMIAHQLSRRGGIIYCQLDNERVKIGGKAIHYFSGEIFI